MTMQNVVSTDPVALDKACLDLVFGHSDALMGVSWYQSAVLWEGSHLTVGFDYQNIYGHAWYSFRVGFISYAGERVQPLGGWQALSPQNHQQAVCLQIHQQVACPLIAGNTPNIG